MSLIPWKPFRDLEGFFDDEDWFLPVVSRNRTKETALNLYETEKDLIAEVSVPGIDPEKIDINIHGDVLEIKGNQEEEKQEKKRNYWKKEIYKKSFERSVKLPVSVDEKKIDAVCEEGILKITMPKKETKQEKSKIKVRKK